MGTFLRRLAARAILLWILVWYLAAVFGMTAGPVILTWRWFREGLAPEIAVLLALMAGALPLMIGAWAINRGGIWESRPVWRVWVVGWALLGWGLIFSMLLA